MPLAAVVGLRLTSVSLNLQVHLIDAAGSSSASCPICVQQRAAGLEYFVEHWRGHMLLLTNKTSTPTSLQSECGGQPTHGARAEPLPGDALPEIGHTAAAAAAAAAATPPATAAGSAEQGDYCLMTLPAKLAGSAAADSWRLLLPVLADSAVTDMDVFDGCVVLHELCSAQPGLRLLQLAEQQGGQPPPELQVVQQQQVRRR
jgi:protease II